VDLRPVFRPDRKPGSLPGTRATVPVLTEPASEQRQALDLIGAAIPLALT
jgi:hypothetical protein